MSNLGVSWTKAERAKAKERDHALFKVASDSKSGRWEATRTTPHDVAENLFLFCVKVTLGTRPADALAEIDWEPDEAFDARREALKATVAAAAAKVKAEWKRKS